jgi:hypothetical protein
MFTKGKGMKTRKEMKRLWGQIKALQRHLSASQQEVRLLKAERQDNLAVISFLRRQLELAKGESD